MFLNKRTGQSALEYTLLLVAVVAAVLAMRAIAKGGIMGSIKDQANQMGKQFSATDDSGNQGDVYHGWAKTNPAKTTVKEISGTGADFEVGSVSGGERMTKTTVEGAAVSNEVDQWGDEAAGP